MVVQRQSFNKTFWIARWSKNFSEGAYENKSFLVDHDENWLIKLAYLFDIFNKLNETNLGLQGKETSIFQANDKIKALIGKLDFWVDCVQENDFTCFSNLNKFLYENESSVTPTNAEEIKDH